MPFSHASPHSKLTDEQHRLIGMFVAEWATAEFFLGLILGRLLLVPEFLSRTYTDSLGAAQIQNAICQAVEIHKFRYGTKLVSIELLDEILALNRRVEKLLSLRNNFAHFCWARSPDDEIFGTSLSGAVAGDKSHKRSFVSLQVSEMRRQYDDLYAVVERMQEIANGLPEASEEAAISSFNQSNNRP